MAAGPSPWAMELGYHEISLKGTFPSILRIYRQRDKCPLDECPLDKCQHDKWERDEPSGNYANHKEWP